MAKSMSKTKHAGAVPLSEEEISDINEYYSGDEEPIHFDGDGDLIKWLHN